MDLLIFARANIVRELLRTNEKDYRLVMLKIPEKDVKQPIS